MGGLVSKQYSLPERRETQLPGNIRLVDVRTLDELASHEEAWNALFIKADRLSPLLSYPWMRAFFENLVRPPEKWLCLLAYENDMLIGILPLVSSYAFRILGFSLHLFKLPYHYAHTSGTDGLTLPGREEVFGVFMEYLKSFPRTLPCLSLKHVPEHYASVKYTARNPRTLCVVKKPAGFECFIDLPESAEKYTAGLHSKFRQNLRRSARELEKIPDVRFLFCDQTRTAQENTARFLEVETRCWKGRDKTAVQNFPGCAEIFTAAAEGLAQQEMMCLSFLESGEKTIAAHYAMRGGRTMYILKMAYDEEYTPAAPGNLLMHNVIEAAANSGAFDEINLISNPKGIDKWNVQRRPIWHLVIFPKIPILSALLRLAIESGKVHNFDIER